jgi:hypothetical protein
MPKRIGNATRHSCGIKGCHLIWLSGQVYANQGCELLRRARYGIACNRVH